MKKLLVIYATLCFSMGLKAQDTLFLSVKDLAPSFGIQARFLNDTLTVAHYLDSLQAESHQLTDSCVSLNARVLAFQNVLLHDYRHADGYVWMDKNTCIIDYEVYRHRLNDLSSYVLRRAHAFIEQEHYRRETVQQEAFNLRKDTINRLHRTIVSACEGFGINDADRKKELRDIYYAYLSVYNRYDLSKPSYSEGYTAELDRFIQFQNHLIDKLLGSANYRSRIKNFYNTLKIRCGHAHVDVLRSYQRTNSLQSSSVKFSTIDGYYKYVDSLSGVLRVQDCYLSVVDLREKIAANSDRITRLYGSRFRQVVKTYQEVAASINTVPSFTSVPNANAFIDYMQEFIKVQDCYINDYNRLSLIKEHGDSISSRCAIRYSDVSKAYAKMVDDLYPKSETPKPAYRSLDDALRFSTELDFFERLQRQYDTIVEYRKLIDRYKDTISKGWMTHILVYNGFQTIYKQMVLTPSFISTADGSRFISELKDFAETEEKCIQAIRLFDEYRRLDNQIIPLIQPYRNIRKAYSRLEKGYITVKAINHTSEVYLYCRQLESFISLQHELMQKATGNDVQDINTRLYNITDLDKIENIIGI